VDLLDADDLQQVRAFVRAGNTSRRYAQHPLLYDLAEVERSPLIGCTMGGISHFAIDSAGRVVPCVFTHVSFGSILEEDLPPILARMRAAIPRPIHGGCPSILLRDQLDALCAGTIERTPVFQELEPIWRRTLYGA
jgi:MoaA/NifB/PqqE/SkfB family radical SAM enzyme